MELCKTERGSNDLSLHFRFMGAPDQAIASGERALALARASGDGVLHALAHQYLGAAYHRTLCALPFADEITILSIERNASRTTRGGQP
jgi:hypothetical protein